MARGQNNEVKVLLVSLVITAGLAAGLFYFLLNNPNIKNLISPSATSPSVSSPGITGNIATRISAGERLLIPADLNPEKDAGIKAIASSDFPTAVQKLEASLQLNRNDPEALIYLNNARIGSGNSLTIAVSVPIGANLNVAKEMLRGVAQAQTEVNQAGGINGVLLKVIIANDDNQAAVGKAIAEQLVKDTRILAVIGPNNSDTSLAGAAIYQAGGLVMISPTATTKKLSGFGNYIYRTVLSAPFQANVLARYAKKEGRNNVGICYSSASEASKSLKEEVTLAVYGNGGKISRVDCDLSAPNLNPAAVISAFVNDGVNAMVLNPGVDNIERSLGIAKENKGRLLLLSDSTLYTIKTLEVGQTAVVGMVLTVPWHPQGIPNSSFPSNAVKLWGGNVNWRTATSYDAALAIVSGLRQNPTRAGLQQALSNPGFSAEGALGQIQFQPSGDRITSPLFVTIQPSAASGQGYSFTPIQVNF